MLGRFAVIDDICNANTEVLVNAANAKGWMGGLLARTFKLSGVSQSLNKKTHGKLEKLAREQAKCLKPKPGDVFVTQSVDPLKVTSVYHAIIMEKPGQPSSLEVVDACYRNIVDRCYELQQHSVTVPLLGIGVGGLKEEDVLEVLYKNFSITELEVVVAHPHLELYN